jgi:hypothetical protein
MAHMVLMHMKKKKKKKKERKKKRKKGKREEGVSARHLRPACCAQNQLHNIETTADGE